MSDSDVLPLVFPVACHTKNIGPGSTFVAIRGQYEDGVHYIPEAIAKGATVIIVQDDASIPPDIALIINRAGMMVRSVPNVRVSLAQLSAERASYPAKKLKIIGITGTKGKTTTAFILAHILQKAGYKTACISTVKNTIGDVDLPPSLTTPQPDYLHQFLKCCVESDVEYVVMEVAAQGLSLHRTRGIIFDGIIFTNFSHEHLEFYPTLEKYFDAKCLIFDQIKSDAPVLINADDEQVSQLLKNHSGFLSFALHIKADFSAVVDVQQSEYLKLMITRSGTSRTFECPSLIGEFNGYNILAAVGMAVQCGITYKVIARALQTFSGVPGRLARYVMPNGATCIIDYAHNPTSYAAVLSLLRTLTDYLIVIFGAGGDRDVSKRPYMGKIAAEIADLIILTTDNPRLEDPNQIINDIVRGVDFEHIHKVMRELDREQAIKKAYELSRSGSIITVLGKGTDEYQIVGKTKLYFSEREIIQQLQ